MNSLKQTRVQTTFKQRAIAAIAVIFIFSVSVGAYRIGFVDAQSEQELRERSSSLQTQITDNEEILGDLETEIDTLDGKVRALNTEISIAQQKIELTDVKLAELRLSLEKAEKELVRQQEILDETLVTLYIEGDTSSIELIFASDNFGEYFAEQQYLESLKISVQDSVDRVAELRERIDSEKKEQEEAIRNKNNKK
jgi:peptidoglycan hydrolase CwlO-like protein